MGATDARGFFTKPIPADHAVHSAATTLPSGQVFHRRVGPIENALRQLKEHGPDDPEYGICYNLRETLPGTPSKPFLQSAFRSWPKCSDDEDYPVPCPDDTGITSSRRFNDTADLWDRDDEYGQLRWELLDHCINEAERLCV